MADYYSILTTAGRAILTNAVALGETVSLTEMAVGDGNGADVIPNQDMTELVHEVYRAGINALEVDSDTTMRAELVVPTDTGGFYVREVGLFTSDGDLFAVANLPLTYKPVTTEGAGRELKVVLLMEVSNAESGSITLKIDPTVVLASRDYVDSEIDAHAARDDNPHQVTKVQVGLGNLPNAKSDSFNLNSPAYLATAKAIYDAYQALLAGIPGAATTAAAGILKLLTDAEATTGTDTTKAATAANIKAVLNKRGLWQYTDSVALPCDFNNLTGSRPYFININSGNTNTPNGTATSSWYVIAMGAGVGFQVQLAIPAVQNIKALYVRKCVDGVWANWETLVTNYNGVVSPVGSCSTPGTWTLTNLAIGRPVFLTYASSTNTSLFMYYRILTGAANCAQNLTSYYSTLGAHDQDTSMSNVGVIMPTDTTVTIDVVQISGITVTARQ